MSRRTATNFSQPHAGDIALCRFPQDLVNPKPGPKDRPAIILKVISDSAGSYQVLVCYATTNTSRRYAWDMVLDPNDNQTGFKAAGLTATTKFDLGQQVWLPYNSDWFLVPQLKPFGLTPKIGVLHATVVPALLRAIAAAKGK